MLYSKRVKLQQLTFTECTKWFLKIFLWDESLNQLVGRIKNHILGIYYVPRCLPETEDSLVSGRTEWFQKGDQKTNRNTDRSSRVFWPLLPLAGGFLSSVTRPTHDVCISWPFFSKEKVWIRHLVTVAGTYPAFITWSGPEYHRSFWLGYHPSLPSVFRRQVFQQN